MSMLDGVYIDAKEEKQIVAIKPKPVFKPLFEIAVMRTGSEVVLVRDDDENRPESGDPAKPKTGPSGPECGDGTASVYDASESNPFL
jgi:hypothetical protein